MITRHGRSASTVSTVLPNSVVPTRGGSGMTMRVRAHLARLVDDQAARLAGAHLLDVAGDAPPALHAWPAR